MKNQDNRIQFPKEFLDQHTLKEITAYQIAKRSGPTPGANRQRKFRKAQAASGCKRLDANVRLELLPLLKQLIAIASAKDLQESVSDLHAVINTMLATKPKCYPNDSEPGVDRWVATMLNDNSTLVSKTNPPVTPSGNSRSADALPSHRRNLLQTIGQRAMDQTGIRRFIVRAILKF
jgi:hypothetical protein